MPVKVITFIPCCVAVAVSPSDRGVGVSELFDEINVLVGVTTLVGAEVSVGGMTSIFVGVKASIEGNRVFAGGKDGIRFIRVGVLLSLNAAVLIDTGVLVGVEVCVVM